MCYVHACVCLKPDVMPVILLDLYSSKWRAEVNTYCDMFTYYVVKTDV